MADSPMTLQQALARFDRKAASSEVKQADVERKEVVERFPLEDWPQLPLSRYALGQGKNEDSFSWWLEFGTPYVGSIRGGNARKHIIYRQKNGEWYFDRDSFKDEQAAWEAARAGFVRAFEKAKAGDWDGMDDIEGLALGPALRTKALHCYFPNEVLPVFSIFHIVHFLNLLGVEAATTKDYEVVRMNRLLLTTLRSRKDFAGWSTRELERFLYFWADPREQRRVVKIAPGEDAKFWPECEKGGYIRVGWGKAGDMRNFESKDAFRTSFSKAYSANYNGHEPTISKKCNEVWTLRELEPGDLVFANKGTSKLLAVGEVVEPSYEWVEREGDDFNNIVHVKWDTSYAQEIEPQKAWAMVTVAPVPSQLAAIVLSKGKAGPVSKGPSGMKLPFVPDDPLFRDIGDALDRKGQVILYGPPGTGKTYKARQVAVWWLLRQMKENPSQVLASREEFKRAEQRFSTQQLVRRVWWMVANPKEWSWDRLFKDKKVDFRHGRLQRNYPLVRRGDLVIGYQSTPDKKLVALAKVSRELYDDDDGDPRIDLEPVARIEDGLTYDQLLADPVLKNSEPMQFRNQGTLFKLTEHEFDHLGAILTERNPDLRRHLDPADGIGPLTRLTFHASYSYEDFVEGFRPVDNGSGTLALRLEDGIFKRVCREAQANPKKPYLVLIDEINRANVAKVLGEVITLLEMDKRGLTISLPQSKEAFTIPPNVFILGTMNTADRSIKLLDAALRRRFAFIELMPDSSLLTGSKVGNLALDVFLDELNRRIAAKEGREKQIGHSFLMDDGKPVSVPEEFARRFRQEILPLLQEYCYEDYKVLAEYIGGKLVNEQAQSLDEKRMEDPDELIAALEEEFVIKRMVQ